jgi:hypothetical protein
LEKELSSFVEELSPSEAQPSAFEAHLSASEAERRGSGLYLPSGGAFGEPSGGESVYFTGENGRSAPEAGIYV